MAAEVAILDDKAQSYLRKLQTKLKKVEGADRAYATLLSVVVFSDIEDHFQKEEGEDGPWVPWSRFYAEHMQQIGKQGNKILQFDGRMRNTFLPTNWRSVGEGILWFNPARTRSGFPYAYAHNEGGPVLPQRSFMWLSENAQERIAVNTLGFLNDAD